MTLDEILQELDNSESEILHFAANYVRSGSESDWKQLAKSDMPEYGSPLERLVKLIPAGIEPGRDRKWDRLLRVPVSFLRDSVLGGFIGDVTAPGEPPETLERLFDLVLPQSIKERRVSDAVFWSRLETEEGSPTAMGRYCLSVCEDTWCDWMIGKADESPGLSGNLARFLSRRAPGRVEKCWRRLTGLGDLKKNGDEIAKMFYENGIDETAEAVLTGVEQCESEFKRFLILRDLCEVDFERFREKARNAAVESLAGDSYTNNHQVPAAWLAKHFPEEAVSLLCQYVRDSENDDSAWSNWGTAAMEALEILGPRGIPLLEACADTTTCDTVLGGVSGAISGGVAPPNELIESMIRRLLRVEDDHWGGLALGELLRWSPETFRVDVEKLASDEGNAVCGKARMALSELELANGDRTNPEWLERKINILLPNIEAELRDQIQKAPEPCLHIVSERCEVDGGRASSHFGGIPLVPDSSFQWPKTRQGKPLPFVARIVEKDWKKVEPDFRGDLLFFADWKDNDAIILPVGGNGEQVLAEPPAVLSPQYPFCTARCEFDWCLPSPFDSWEDWRFQDWEDESSGLSEGEIGSLFHAFSGRSLANPGKPAHRALAHSRFTQHSPKAEAAGVIGPMEEPPRPEEDWVSILSLETDETVGLCFYDTGTMTFLVPKLDWDERNFDRVFLNVDYH